MNRRVSLPRLWLSTSKKCTSGTGKLLSLLPDHLHGSWADTCKGQVVVEEADEDEGDNALCQAIANFKQPNGVEGAPYRRTCHKEDSLEDLPECKQDQQRTKRLESAAHHRNEDLLVVHDCEGESNLKDKTIRTYFIKYFTVNIACCSLLLNLLCNGWCCFDSC